MHPVGDAAHHRQVVADEQPGQPEPPRQIRQQIEDLRPHRDVQGRDRLVQDQQIRPDDQRPGDGDALALATGEFVDVLAGIFGRQPDRGQRLGHRRLPLGAFGRAVEQVERLGHQPGDAVARVEAAVGILEHHLDAAAHRAVGAVIGEHRLAAQGDGARLHLLQPQDRPGQRGLAATGFAHQPHPFALGQRQRHPVDRPEPRRRCERAAPPHRIVAHHVLDPQQHRRARFRRRQRRDMGRGGEQHPGIGMFHPRQQRRGLAGLDHLARPHHRDPVGDAGDHRKVMGDQQHPHAVLDHQTLAAAPGSAPGW